MLAIERDNPSLKGVLPKDYAHPRLDKQRLGQLLDLVGNIGLGDKANRSKDILGRVYEYFLSQSLTATSIPPLVATSESPTLEVGNWGMKKEITCKVKLLNGPHMA